MSKFNLAFFIMFSLVFSSVCLAYDSRLGIDPNVNLGQLSRTGVISVQTSRQGALYRSDASAVLHGVDFERLWNASMDYDHYVQMGMPGLKASRIVQRTPDHLYIWSQMTAVGQTSRHYLEVRRVAESASSVRAVEWQLFHPRAGSGLSDPDRALFLSLNGSWYIERLADGGIYVRYFLSADPDVGIPDVIISGMAQSQFAEGVRQVILALARQAAVRQ